MKANKIEDGTVLMIGDLVIGCIETDTVGEATYKIPCKVTNINHYGDVSCEALEPFPDELDWQDGDDFSWIEPIPLTPEILEKNGWEKGGYEEMVNITDEYSFALQKGVDGKNAWWWEMFSSPIIPINYVHELQHALRLCGIEKEITI